MGSGRIVSLLGSCALVVVGCLMSAAAPIDGTFNYQARLTSGGVPITGTVDARFSLWDAAAAGTQIGSSIEFLGESVSDGLYNADLDFGVAALNGDVRWLQVEVRSPAGVGAYVILGRREILGAPYAIQTRGLFVDDDLNVGIGTTTPAGRFQIDDPVDGRSLLYSPGAFYDFSLTSPTGAAIFGNVPFNAGEHSQLFFTDGVGGALNAAIGTAAPEGDGFINIYGEDGAQNFQLRGNPDATTDGVSNTRMYIRSSGPGGVGGELSVQNNDGAETIELLGGGSASAGTVSLFDQTTGTATVTLEGDAFALGGRIATWSANGIQQFEIEPDGQGSGAFLTLKRNEVSNGLTFDGNDSGTGDPKLTISGASRFVNIQTRLTGSASVELPTDAVEATEILDEPGVASSHGGGGGLVVLTGGCDTILSRTITVPTSGYCVVIGTCVAWVTHLNGAISDAFFGVSDETSLLAWQNVQIQFDDALPTGTYRQPFTVHGTYSVSAGANTFYLIGNENSGAFAVQDFQLTVMYFPTAYGVVTPAVLARGGADDNASAPQALPMSANDVYAEQIQAAVFDRNRRASEAADYAQQMADMQAQLDQVLREQESLRNELRRAGPPIENSGAVLGHNTAGSR